MPLRWQRGTNPYIHNYFGRLRIGPNANARMIVEQAKNLRHKLAAGKHLELAGQELDEHAIGEAAERLREPGPLAEELLLVHPQSGHKALLGEFDSTKNPHRVALRSLGLEGLGRTRSAYSDEAFRIWGERLRRDPDDLETLHHLAIMHHARAMDLEAGPKPRESDANWQKALDYWAKLWRSDPFWEGIVAQACKGTKADVVDALRKELPERLLQVHFDVALDDFTRKERPHRSAYHLELARRSGFPNGSIEEVQRASYAVWLSGVPDAVWRTDELDPKVIQEAAGVILDFLDLVPDCLPALEDAARLQVRMLNAWYTDFQAVGEEEPRERQRLLSDFQTAGKRWRPHFDRLVTLVEQTDDSTRHDLCLWYRIMAESHRALDLSDDAERLYELGMLAGDQDDEDVARCSRGLGETRAFTAREKAAAAARDARASCDRARNTAGLSLLAHLVLAQAYLLIKEFDYAEALCRRGLEREIHVTDLDDCEATSTPESSSTSCESRSSITPRPSAVAAWSGRSM